MDFWKVGIVQNSTYEMKMKLYVEYWEDILLHLSRRLPPQSVIFWKAFGLQAIGGPWASLSIVMDIVDIKDPVQLPYCGSKNMKPLTAYTPFRDLNVGDFVLARPHVLDFVPVWMGGAEGDVVKDEKSEYFKMVRVQWWVPMKKISNLDERHLYEDCWNGK
jgi:hypothetical protein